MKSAFKVEDLFAPRWEKEIARRVAASLPLRKKVTFSQLNAERLRSASCPYEFSFGSEQFALLSGNASVAKFLFLSFYWPAYDKADIGEALSRYEVLIPYREQEEGTVKYRIVPAGAHG